MLLRIPEPYDFELSTARFRDFGTDGATVLHEGGVHRVVQGRELRIEAAPGGVRFEPASAGAVDDVGHLLGLPFELEPFRAWSARDPVLHRIVEQIPGFRPPLHPDAFEALVVAITTQQISLRAAAAIRGRFVERYGVRHDIAWEFPSRERVALADPSDFPALGFSRRKAEYVLGLARSELDLAALAALPTRRSSPPSLLFPGSAAGRRTGSSHGTSPAPRRGPRATSACARRSRRSTLAAAH